MSLSRSTKGEPSRGPSIATPQSSIQIHTHSSIPSHLLGELAFLESLIQRAKDQHRHQPFLQRMKEISRLGKLVLRIVQRRQLKKNENEKLGLLLIKLTHALFRAHRNTCQIIELHHFLPLQLTTLALYARIFTIVLNIGNSIGITAAHLIAGQQQPVAVANVKEENRKERTESSFSLTETETMIDPDKYPSTYTASAFKDDIGEKIERKLPSTLSSIPALAPSQSQSPSLQKIATKAAVGVAAQSASRSPASLPVSVPASPRLPPSLPNDDDHPQTSSRASSPSISTKSHVRPRNPEIQSIPPIPIGTNLREIHADPTTTNTERESTMRAKTGSKRSSTAKDVTTRKKLKQKKKKKDTMDDIFGF